MRTTAMTLAAAALALAACSKDKPSGSEEAKADPAAAVAAIMTPYEACRTKLAADSGEVADCAAAIAKAATGTPEIAGAADALAETDSADLDALRKQFGEVSRPIERLIGSVPAVAGDYDVYQCPMAKGFNRWIQPAGSEMANPYMGTEMLKCGSKVAGK